MARTNDALIYGSRVELFVTGNANDAESLARTLPSRTSKEYGKSFAEVLRDAGWSFYAIDQMLSGQHP